MVGVVPGRGRGGGDEEDRWKRLKRCGWSSSGDDDDDDDGEAAGDFCLSFCSSCIRKRAFCIVTRK